MKQTSIAVKGRDLVSGIPKTVEISSDEIRQALKDCVTQIVDAVKRALEKTPPELAVDILDRGIILTGGGASLKGLDQNIRERTNLAANVSESPMFDVVKGTGIVLSDVKKYADVLIQHFLMRRFLGFLVERKDYVTLILAVIFSIALLSSDDSEEIRIIRGKTNDVLNVLYSPVQWVRDVNILKRENEILKSRSVQLKLLNSSLINYKYENERLREMLGI